MPSQNGGGADTRRKLYKGKRPRKFDGMEPRELAERFPTPAKPPGGKLPPKDKTE